MEKLKKWLDTALQFIKNHPFKFALYCFLSGFGAIVLFIFLIYVGAFGKIPSKEYLKDLKNPVTSSLYDDKGELIGYYFLQNRSNIDASQITPEIKNALIATEDVRFYEHNGIDYTSFFRVFFKSIVLRENAGGGSTITQQVAKNLFGRQKRFFLSTVVNKISEMIVANRLENIYSKDDILLLYFNTVTFGENLYGLEKATKRFFNKSPENLTLSESALLVGLLKATTSYNPKNNPERSIERRNVVLGQMEKYNYITPEDAARAKETPLKLNYVPEKKVSSYSSYFKEYISEEFNEWAQNNPAPDGHIYSLETDGLQIHTTLKSSVQKSAERALVDQINRLQVLMNQYWRSVTTEGGKDALIDQLIGNHKVVKRMRVNSVSESKIAKYVAEVKDRKYWKIGEGYVNMPLSLKDSIIRSVNRLHASVVAMNSKTGAILGYIGGIDYGYSQTDQIRFKRQMGSTFKPITYLAALEAGEDPCNFYNNDLITYPDYDDWKPTNADAKYGGSYSMHGALANSINTVAVALQIKTGSRNVRKQAEAMGIDSGLKTVPSMVLGTSEISLLKMVRAYAAISNGGEKIKPYAIAKIIDEHGKTIYKAKPKTYGRVASERNVMLLQKMMEGVVRGGTAGRFNSYGINKNIIGKTGTTQNNRDGLFIACSPELVVGSWVGPLDVRVQFTTTNQGSGANTALPIVAAVFKDINAWRTPFLTNFSYDFQYFPCPTYSYARANEAYMAAKSDSTYIDRLLERDSIARAERQFLQLEKMRMDSIQKANPEAVLTPQ